MEMIHVYIAGPMGKDAQKRRAFVVEAGKIGLEFVQLGFSVYVPHLWDYVNGSDDCALEKWMAQDLSWVSICDAVLRIPGESPGADVEVRRAQELGIPVFSSVSELTEHFSPPRQKAVG